MMYDNENPNQVFLIDGDISKTLTNCATDANPSTRQEYGRALLYILRQQPLEEILKNIHDIISTLLMISEDEVSAVRIHLVDQIVSIILQVREHASPDLEYYLYDRLLQILLKYFQDDDYMVKGEASSAINLLLDKGAIDKKMLIERACPIILNYTKHYDDENEEGRTATAVALIGRIAPIIGGEALEELFLDNYLEMCSRAATSIRHPCATIFPVMCQVLGTEITEKRMVDAFIALANSEQWSLRKLCAEHLALVASVCSEECRRDRLTRIVLKLAKDTNNHVVSATFKVLGQYIATFSTPKITGLAYTQEGELYITNPLDSDFSKHSDPQLVASYNDYINRSDEACVQPESRESSLSTSMSLLKITSSPNPWVSSSWSFSSFKTADQDNIKCDSDSMSCEQIAKFIQDHIVEINKKINVDVLMKKRKAVWYNEKLMGGDSGNCSSDDINKLNDTQPPLSTDEGNEGLDMSIGDDKTGEGDRLNNYLTFEHSESKSEEGESLPNLLPSPSSRNYVDKENNSTRSEEGDVLNDSSESPGKKARKSLPPIEHFWRKNTPTDLSSIIKNAIVEAKKLHQQPLHEKRKLMMPPPPPTAIECQTPTSEEPSKPLAWDAFLTNECKSKSTDRLNECQANDFGSAFGDGGDDDDAFNEYNSHKFWYIRPDVVLDNDLVNETPDTHHLDDIISTRAHFDPPTDFNQNIVPVEILETYVKMVLHEEDEEVNLICVYDFPAVAFTLGKQNWHILKKLLQYLCDDLDWKVRKTVATYIDLLAIILGKELATEDLLPIFIGFFKDLDQVKIKAIGNFAKFLKFIDFSKHEEILSNIGICLRIDSKTNWRIKEDLAQQILLIIKWYDSINMHDYLLYLASVTGIFLDDKISCVREVGAEAMTEIIRICNPKEREALIKHYLVKEFSLSYSWRKRQTFVNIFYKFVCCNKSAMDLVEMVLQDIRRLSYDAVPNIRLLVAKSLVQLINNNSHILTSGNCDDVDIVKMVRRLQEDDDRDVREIAQLVDLQCGKQDDSESFKTSTVTAPPSEQTAQFPEERTMTQPADDSTEASRYNYFCEVSE
ncbi:serine/threonine-protein phosphatase 4 regulatory subunit 1-like isoform X2 [Hermetia illucens]|nr:serine/threonine-protein phosphatase 4 regulatory subunit 1-like isoform X2 [Hermetia illucens]